VEWSVRYIAPEGTRGKAETPQHSEENQVPPCEKRVSAASWNELVIAA